FVSKDSVAWPIQDFREFVVAHFTESSRTPPSRKPALLLGLYKFSLRARKPKPLHDTVQQPSTWSGRSEQILLNQVGCEARKLPADGEVFFLDFPFYRTWLGRQNQVRAGITVSSLRTIAATRVPRISMARNIFWCGSVE